MTLFAMALPLLLNLPDAQSLLPMARFVPVKIKTTQQLVSTNVHDNTANVK
jgi:hypothetical protein